MIMATQVPRRSQTVLPLSEKVKVLHIRKEGKYKYDEVANIYGKFLRKIYSFKFYYTAVYCYNCHILLLTIINLLLCLIYK